MSAKLEYLAYAIGVVVGIIFVFQEYRQKAPASDAIDKYQRLKNFIVVVGGTGVIGAIIDWKGLAKVAGKDLEIDRWDIAISYSLSAAFTILFLLLLALAWIVVDAIRRNRSVPDRARVHPISAIGLFLSRGYHAYEERVEQMNKKLRDEQEGGNAVLGITQAISVAIISERTYQTTKQNLAIFASKILELVVTVVAGQLPEAEKSLGKINYMRAIPKERATPQQLAMIRFAEPPYDDYSHILVLEQYTLGTITPKFALAVHREEQQCLPGAPMAFFKKQPVPIVTGRIEFAAGVSKRTRNDINTYFKREKFRSFLSVPMQKGEEIVGVVNIEAKTNLFDPRDPRINNVAESLHPLCMSLAYLVT